MFQNNKPGDRKIMFIILSVLLAVALWFYVVTQQDPDIDLDFNGIPVVFQGEEDVLKEKDLMISSGGNATVNLKLVGKRNVLLNLENKQIVVTADVSQISSAGDYSLSYKVSFPSSSGIAVLQQSRDTVDITVSKLSSKSVPIVGVFNGSVAEGFLAEDFIFYPETIQLSGISEDIAQISHALVTLTGTDVSQTIETDAPYQLVDYSGNIVTFDSIKFPQPTVHVSLPIVTTAEIPLTVEFLDGGGATAANVSYTISPEKILVSGEPDDLKSLKSIVLGTIDLSKLLNATTLTYQIPLSNGLTNQSGIAEAEVSVTIFGLASKTLVASNIEVINAPEGYNAHAVTQSLPVTVRGTDDTIAMIFEYNIRIVADLSEIKEATGNYTMPAKVYLDGYGGAGIVGDYKVVVSISK